MRLPSIVLVLMACLAFLAAPADPAALAAQAAQAASPGEFRPILIYQGDIMANTFNLTIHEGVQRFVAKYGTPCEELVVGNEDGDFMNALEKTAQEGYDPIFLIYGNHVKGLASFIRRYPNTRFIALGTSLDASNLFSLDFAEHEGSFLAGALAAMVSKTKTIGFISVSDLPLMRRFSCGYEQGARYVDPDVKVLVGFIGSYKNAWFDNAATAKMANAFMDEGADVIYQAAGGAGMGVLDACARRGKLAIGVDRNQNGVHPGFVLTSMLKKTDQVIFAALTHAKRGIWRDNVKSFGVAQDAVGLAFDENNAAIVPEEVRKRIEDLKSKIILGKIEVHDYVEDNACH